MTWEIIIIPVAIVFVIIYRTYFVSRNSSKLNELIKAYYESDKYEIVLIRKLSFNEKIRYRDTNGLSMFFAYRKTGFFCCLVKQPDSYFRVIEFKAAKDIECQVYVEIEVLNQQIVNVTEFDSYDL